MSCSFIIQTFAISDVIRVEYILKNWTPLHFSHSPHALRVFFFSLSSSHCGKSISPPVFNNLHPSLCTVMSSNSHYQRARWPTPSLVPHITEQQPSIFTDNGQRGVGTLCCESSSECTHTRTHTRTSTHLFTGSCQQCVLMINKQGCVPFFNDGIYRPARWILTERLNALSRAFTTWRMAPALYFFSPALHFHPAPPPPNPISALLLFILDSGLCIGFVDVRNAINTFIKGWLPIGKTSGVWMRRMW